jgi:Putative porin
MIASRWRCDAVHIHQLLPPIIKSYKHRFQTGTQRIKVFGDMRMRSWFNMQPKSNDPFLPNYDAINTSANGYDVNNTAGTLPPLLNTTENRTTYQVEARVGIAVQISDWVDGVVGFGTGNSNTPVSLNQNLGSPGDFSKYGVWLDLASISLHPTNWLSINAGRGINPFWTTDLLFYKDLRFDGISVQVVGPLTKTVGGFFTVGAFPVFNTDFNFGSNNDVKTASHDSYLFAAQGGATWQINENYQAKLGVGYFDFTNVQGVPSTPCFNPTAYGSCDTDDSKAPFLQFGDTLFPVRNIIANPSGVTALPELYGLASQFRILDINGQFTMVNFHPIDIVFFGDFAKNFGFSSSSIVNLNPVNNLSSSNSFVGGDIGYTFGATIGIPVPERLFDWNVSVAYKYLESDAVLDSLTDSVFHNGGTNAKGYILKGNLALTRNTWLTASWYSTNQISGPTYAVDTLLLDLNAKF